VRKALAERNPSWDRGRFPQHARQIAHQRKCLDQKITKLFTHRPLFVQRHLSASEWETF
jgi:hypothetical protein